MTAFQHPDVALSHLPAPRAVPSSPIPAHGVAALDHLVALPPTLALQQAFLVVRQLAEEFATLLDRGLPVGGPTGPEGGPQLVQHQQGRDAAWWLGYFRWPPGAVTPIHDHTSWGVYACAGGALLETRYRRLDDGAQPSRAHLRLGWERQLGRGNSSTLQAYAGGIHRLTNPGTTPAWSVHLYGPRLGRLDGRDYDPTRDYVCERWA